MALFGHGPEQPRWIPRSWLPRLDVSRLIREVVVKGNRRTLAQSGTPGLSLWLGNDIVRLAGTCPPTDDWPTAELGTEQLRPPRPAPHE